MTLLVAALLALLPQAGPAPAASALQLAKIDATGVKRYTVAEVARVSGLTVGKTVAIADIDAAAKKLATTGLFKDVRYRYATAAGQVTVTFEIEEIEWGVPVVFDNFVWFSDEELTKAVRAEVPSFDGTAPPGGGVTDLIAAALGHVLQARHLPGRIDYMPYSKLDGSGRQHIFSVKDPGVKTCGLHVDGTSGVPERDVMKVAQSLIGIDYSRHYVADFSRKSMTQPYRQRGYWRAAFQGPITTIGGVPGCDGVQVTLRVDEGLSYAWDHAEWTGNAAFTARELDGLLAFKPGDVADGAKIEAGLRLINAAHGKRGYLAEQATSEPVLDDSAKRAVFRIAIAEGPQFHMGTFTVAGLSAKDAESLAKRWKLKPGEVYDQTYLQEFQITELRAYSTPAHPATAQVRPDSRTHIVDVTIVFK